MLGSIYFSCGSNLLGGIPLPIIPRPHIHITRTIPTHTHGPSRLTRRSHFDSTRGETGGSALRFRNVAAVGIGAFGIETRGLLVGFESLFEGERRFAFAFEVVGEIFLVEC